MKFRWYGIFVLLVLHAGCTGFDRFEGNVILVDPGWVADRKGDPSTVLLHVGTREVYDSIHLPEARYIHPYWFSPDTDSLWNELPSVDSVISMLCSRGVSTDSEIVLYAESEDFAFWTARVFLTLDFAGLGEHTHVLNGGMDRWISQGKETTDLVPEIIEVSPWKAIPKQVTIEAMEVALNRYNPSFMVVDARSETSYHGKLDSLGRNPEGGHIEGAYSLPASKVVTDSLNASFRPSGEITALFNHLGMEPDKTTVFYCGSGVLASVDYLAARNLGYHALVYDGSFQEWEKLGWAITGPVPAPASSPESSPGSATGSSAGTGQGEPDIEQ